MWQQSFLRLRVRLHGSSWKHQSSQSTIYLLIIYSSTHKSNTKPMTASIQSSKSLFTNSHGNNHAWVSSLVSISLPQWCDRLEFSKWGFIYGRRSGYNPSWPRQPHISQDCDTGEDTASKQRAYRVTVGYLSQQETMAREVQSVSSLEELRVRWEHIWTTQ